MKERPSGGACQDECLANEVRTSIMQLSSQIEAINIRLDEGREDIDAHGVVIRGNGLEHDGMFAQLNRLKSDVKVLKREKEVAVGKWFSVLSMLLGVFFTSIAGATVALVIWFLEGK